MTVAFDSSALNDRFSHVEFGLVVGSLELMIKDKKQDQAPRAYWVDFGCSEGK